MYNEELKIVLILFGFIPFACCAKWIIMLENSADVEKEYFYIRKAAATVSATDQFRDKTAAELVEVCDRLKNSKIYHRLHLPHQSPIPQPSRVNEIPQRGENESDRLQDLSYKYRPLKTAAPETKTDEQVLVFLCETHENTTFWLTYGYSSDVLFLLEEVEGGQAVSFVGQSVPLPNVDHTSTQGKSLDDYYYLQKATRMFERSMPKDPYPFVDSVQFRLCCLAHAAKEEKHEERESFTINYANFDPNVEKNRYNIRAHDSSMWLEFLVWALGCSVNPTKDVNEFQFYLRYNVTNPFQVFALEPVGFPDGDKVLRVKQLLVKVRILLASAFNTPGMDGRP